MFLRWHRLFKSKDNLHAGVAARLCEGGVQPTATIDSVLRLAVSAPRTPHHKARLTVVRSGSSSTQLYRQITSRSSAEPCLLAVPPVLNANCARFSAGLEMSSPSFVRPRNDTLLLKCTHERSPFMRRLRWMPLRIKTYSHVLVLQNGVLALALANVAITIKVLA